MSVDLRFRSAGPLRPDLRFGADDELPPEFLDITGDAMVSLPVVSSALVAQYDNAVSRGPSSACGSIWRSARGESVERHARMPAPKKMAASVSAPIMAAEPLKILRSTAWKGKKMPARADRSSRHAKGVSSQLFADVFYRNRLAALKRETSSSHSTALPSGIIVGTGWIVLDMSLRPEARILHRHGIPSGVLVDSWWRPGVHTGIDDAAWWAGADSPPPGRSVIDNGGGAEEQQHLSSPVALVFDGAGSLDLRFGAQPVPAGTIVVPTRRIYMVNNTQTLTLADSGMEIPAAALSVSIDKDSWCWGWQATVPAAYLEILQAAIGDRTELVAGFNGTDFLLVLEKISRTREFGKSTLSLSGRGRAAWLDAPLADSVSRYNESAMTAQQIMAAALTENGQPLGWSIDWKIDDWTVPAGSWSHTGTAMEACLAIAGAAGAYIQSHPTDQILHVLPLYPTPPWEWSGTTPDIIIPDAVASVEDIEWTDKPEYNTVFIAGQRGGILAHVTRAGTAGDKPAPMVTDPLNTAIDAGRQRGIAILADTGRQKSISLSLPVLEETGIILPGRMVRYTTADGDHIGITRAVSVDGQFPKLKQKVTVESHA